MDPKNEPSSGISTAEAVLRVYSHFSKQLFNMKKNIPDFSPLLKQTEAVSGMLINLSNAAALKRTAETFNSVFSPKNMENISKRLENLSSLGSANFKLSGHKRREIVDNLQALFTLTKTEIPEELQKKFHRNSINSASKINKLVNDSLHIVASHIGSLTPANILKQIDVPLQNLATSMESKFFSAEADSKTKKSIPSNSSPVSAKKRSYSAIQSSEFSNADRMASVIAEKIVSVLSMYPSSSVGIKSRESVSLPDSKDVENIAKNISNITSEKTLSRMNDMRKTIRDVDKNILSSVSTINSISQTLNAYSEAAIQHIQNQARAALDNLFLIYEGSQGLITRAEEELQEFREARIKEEEERRIRQEEEDFAYRQELYEKELRQLEAALSSETNIRNAKKLEAELEEKRREKREEQEKRSTELEERKRQEELDRKEEELLKEKQLREWEYEVQKIQIQNDVGKAEAEAERQAAIISKTTQTAQLTGQIAMTTAQAVINMANPLTLAIGIAQMTAAAAAAAQIGLIAATPLPAAYTPVALPARPFAEGGIIPALPDGLPIRFGTGSLGVVAEAGHDELVLPLTQANIDKFLKPFSEKSDYISHFTYSPQINISVEGQKSPEETLAYIREHLQRDLLDTVEEAKSRFSLRSS